MQKTIWETQTHTCTHKHANTQHKHTKAQTLFFFQISFSAFGVFWLESFLTVIANIRLFSNYLRHPTVFELYLFLKVFYLFKSFWLLIQKGRLTGSEYYNQTKIIFQKCQLTGSEYYVETKVSLFIPSSYKITETEKFFSKLSALNYTDTVYQNSAGCYGSHNTGSFHVWRFNLIKK